MRKNEKDSDPEKIETLEEIEADIAKILEGFNDFHEEIDLDDGSWGLLIPKSSKTLRMIKVMAERLSAVKRAALFFCSSK